MKNKLKNYVDSKRNYIKELEILKNKEEFIYIVYFDNNIKQFQDEYENYVKFIKNNLIKPDSLVEFNYEYIKKEHLKDFTYGKNVFPLLVIKEKNKGIEFIDGIRTNLLTA